MYKIGKDVLGSKVPKFTPHSFFTKKEAKSLKPLMKTLSIEKLGKKLRENGLLLTAKINGEFNVFHYVKGAGLYSINRYGTVRGANFGHNNEMRKILDKLGINEAIFLGEVYSVTDGKMDKLPTFVHKIRSKDSNLLKDVRIALFDLVSVNGKKVKQPYSFRIGEIENWVKSGKRVHVVPHVEVKSLEDIDKFWKEWVESGNYEGLVARDGTSIYKIKPEKSVDAVMIGVNKKDTLKDGIVTSIMLALMRKDGCFVKLSDVAVTDSKLRVALYQFFRSRKLREDKNTIYIRPEIVFEVGYIDSLSSVRPVFGEGLKKVGKMKFFSLVSPKILRLRDDKDVDVEDLRLEQIES